MKKKICFIVDSIFTFGGVQRVTAVIAKELAKKHDVTIVTFDKAETKNTSLYNLSEEDIHYRFFSYPEISKLKIKCCKAYSFLYRKMLLQTKLTSDWYAHSSFPSELRKALIQELNEGDYDVIIGDHAPLAVRLASCKNELKATILIGWIHNSYDALFRKDSLYQIGPELRKHYEFQLQKLDATVVLSKNDAQKYHIVTKVIYNPLTLIPGKLSTGTSKKFLAIGRFSRQHKGFDLLIEAFHIFSKDNKEWTLDIVGEGVEEPIYRDLIRQYKLENRITIHPFTNNVQDYYSEAQVYVLSSRWEGFGLVLVEAMAHGLPVVSSDLPTSKEIMGNFGMYFSNGNVNDLAKRLAEATQVNWIKKTQEAQEIAMRFDVKSIIKQWYQLIYAT